MAEAGPHRVGSDVLNCAIEVFLIADDSVKALLLPQIAVKSENAVDVA